MKKPIIIMLSLLAATVVAQQLALQDTPEPGEARAATADESEAAPVAEEQAGAADDAADDEDVTGESAQAESDTARTTMTIAPEDDIPEVDESELTTEIEDDFEPTEEISEDYPVPLPSDI